MRNLAFNNWYLSTIIVKIYKIIIVQKWVFSPFIRKYFEILKNLEPFVEIS